MKHHTAVLAAALAFTAGVAAAQNSTSSLSVVPGLNAESSGTVTGPGPGRDGLFGSPSDSDVGAARGSTQGSAKGAASGKEAAQGRSAGTGSDKRSSGAAGAAPFETR